MTGELVSVVGRSRLGALTESPTRWQQDEEKKQAKYFVTLQWEVSMIEASVCRSLIFGSVSEARNLLLENGIDVNAQICCGVRPISLALKLRSKEAIAMLLSLGANVDLQDNIKGSSILYDAYWETSEYEDSGQLGLLLDAGLPIDRLDDEGLSLLMRAVGSYVWTTKYLLEKGADPNLQDARGWTALMYAARTDRHLLLSKAYIAEVVALLISHGATLDLKNEAGETAGDILMRQSHTPRISSEVKQLLGK